jgi:hypothetical protein
MFEYIANMKMALAIIAMSALLSACIEEQECNGIAFVDFDTVINDLEFNKNQSKHYNKFGTYDLLFVDISAYDLLRKIDPTKRIDTTGLHAWRNNSGVVSKNYNIRSNKDLFCNQFYLNELLKLYQEYLILSTYNLDSLVLIKQDKALFSISNSNEEYLFLVTLKYPNLKLQLVSSIRGCEEFPDEPINTNN